MPFAFWEQASIGPEIRLRGSTPEARPYPLQPWDRRQVSCGHGAISIDWPSKAKACHSSSVTKGIKGRKEEAPEDIKQDPSEAIRLSPSSPRRRALPFQDTSPLFAPCKIVEEAARLAEEIAPQKVRDLIVWLILDNIHLSARSAEEGSEKEAPFPSQSPRFIKARRQAFHNLLRKKRYVSIL